MNLRNRPVRPVTIEPHATLWHRNAACMPCCGRDSAHCIFFMSSDHAPGRIYCNYKWRELFIPARILCAVRFIFRQDQPQRYNIKFINGCFVIYQKASNWRISATRRERAAQFGMHKSKVLNNMYQMLHFDHIRHRRVVHFLFGVEYFPF